MAGRMLWGSEDRRFGPRRELVADGNAVVVYAY